MTRVCASCGAEYKWDPEKESESFSLLCPKCMSDEHSHELPWDRYIVALERLKTLIEGGLKLSFYNCNEIGMKENWCTWGLCSESKELWPDAQDHLWPYSFTTEGRVAPRYRQKGQHCPLDAKPNRPLTPSGCFYSCRVFGGKSFLLSPEIVVAAIDKLLEAAYATERDTAEVPGLSEPHVRLPVGTRRSSRGSTQRLRAGLRWARRRLHIRS